MPFKLIRTAVATFPGVALLSTIAASMVRLFQSGIVVVAGDSLVSGNDEVVAFSNEEAFKLLRAVEGAGPQGCLLSVQNGRYRGAYGKQTI